MSFVITYFRLLVLVWENFSFHSSFMATKNRILQKTQEITEDHDKDHNDLGL